MKGFAKINREVNIMRVESSNQAAKAYAATKENSAVAKETKDAKDSGVKTQPRTDTIEISKASEETKKTEDAKKTDQQKVVADLIADSERRTAQFQEMLKAMFVKQGENYNVSFQGMKLNVTPADSAKAQKAIEPGGEYSVDAVAGRIMDMAKALSGGDKSKIALLKDAVKEGFKAAGMEFGQDLPQISNDTYDEIMKRFDEWEKGDTPEATKE